MAQLTGDLAQYQNVYDVIDAGAFSGMSDGSKSAFWNYIAADKANQHEIDMWALNNAYNDPSRQMERLVKAGINPAAAYQQVSSGNSSSAPGTHKPSYQFDNQAQKMQRVNTIMNTITSVLQGIGSVVNAASGIQGMSINYQKSYTDQLRYQYLNSGIYPHLMNSEYLASAGIDPSMVFKVGGDAYISGRDAVLFPELVAGGRLQQAFENTGIQHENANWLNQIREKSLESDKLISSLIDQISHGDFNWQDALKLIFIQLFKRY